MAIESIVPESIDDAYPVAGQDNDSQGFRDNFNIIKTNTTYTKTALQDLDATVVKNNQNNVYNDNVLERAILKLNSELHESVSEKALDMEISLQNGHHFTIPNQADRTLTLVGWSPYISTDPLGDYQEMFLYLKSDTGDAWQITLAGKNAAGTATAEYFVDASFGGARVVTMPTDDTTFKIIKAYTYDKGVSIFLENIGTFTRITP